MIELPLTFPKYAATAPTHALSEFLFALEGRLSRQWFYTWAGNHVAGQGCCSCAVPVIRDEYVFLTSYRSKHGTAYNVLCLECAVDTYAQDLTWPSALVRGEQ